MKISAMFLPQFHEDPHNSKWWGKGFTEWNNVRAAVPAFQGHNQPRIPLDGYFNLSDPQELCRQAVQATSHGIDAFTFYDYWYEGTRLLMRPLDQFLANPDIEIEFSLCWANHAWTRSWTNRTGALDVLIRQSYAPEGAARLEHYEHLCNAFADPRYLRINGRPIFQVYDPHSIPAGYLEGLKRYASQKIGTSIHLSAFVTAWRADWSYLSEFDSATLFQPSAALFSPATMFGTTARKVDFETRLRNAPLGLKKLIYIMQDLLPDRIRLHDYADTWRDLLEQYEVSAQDCPVPLNAMAFVDFDNSARYRGRARIMSDFTVEKFRAGLTNLVDMAAKREADVLFINAWNEWGEAAYLQPDAADGLARLEVVRDAKSRI